MPIPAEDTAAAWWQAAQLRQAVRALVGSGGVAVQPSAASLATRRHADPAMVDAVDLRTMAITGIAGLALIRLAGQPHAETR
jgi:amidase